MGDCPPRNYPLVDGFDSDLGCSWYTCLLFEGSSDSITLPVSRKSIYFFPRVSQQPNGRRAKGNSEGASLEVVSKGFARALAQADEVSKDFSRYPL